MSQFASDRAVIVYRATNVVNGSSYIGFTTQGLARRIQDHYRCAKRGDGWLLHAAIRKYGIDNVRFDVLRDFEGDEELAKAYEIEAIAKHRPEYNISRGGDGGSVHPDTARKISEANKGRPPIFKGGKFSPDALAKFRATKARNGKPPGNAGKKASPEKLAKMRAAMLGKSPPMKGKKYSLEIRQRMLLAARSRKPRVYSEADKARLRETAKLAHAVIRKAVLCMNDGRVFESAVAASRFYGLGDRIVSRIITGDIKNSSSGLSFEYLTKGQV